ncbi:Trans-aconitate 2-methyltransferase [Microbacterium azadirachtae]|uniref:Trans-aconitate 2-methyltransferase n=1 Tax=Microbacterium azadirachtae TaxID=582680 RepID=A0A0F0L170_9MICO|nr:class I SAM-dependent methyltransferase [Microbacterium azadirachtae]KJL26863.1 Trans-aconitate 2-methyltransferase [Microbacterium azadirachtae]
MNHEFDKNYWESHWDGTHGSSGLPAHPALSAELTDLRPGTAIDAGSGEGAEATWLAAHGWAVTAVDISAHAVTRAAASTSLGTGGGSVTWIEADLTEWEPDQSVDLVTTFYAHPTMPQLAFYKRISEWVAPHGTLLIVGHCHHGSHSDGHMHPENAVATPEQVRNLLDPGEWVVHTAEIRERVVRPHGDAPVALADVIIRAQRRPAPSPTGDR